VVEYATLFGGIQAGIVFAFVPNISSRSAASDMIRLLDVQPEVDAELTEGKIPQNVKGHTRLQEVYFRFPTHLVYMCFAVSTCLWTPRHVCCSCRPSGRLSYAAT